MKKRNIFDISLEIFSLLSKKSELSINAIAREVGCNWRTAVRVLEFLCDLRVAKEKKVFTGPKRYKRVFALR